MTCKDSILSMEAEIDAAMDRLNNSNIYDGIPDWLADGWDTEDIPETFTQRSFRNRGGKEKIAQTFVHGPIEKEELIPF